MSVLCHVFGHKFWRTPLDCESMYRGHCYRCGVRPLPVGLTKEQVYRVTQVAVSLALRQHPELGVPVVATNSIAKRITGNLHGALRDALRNGNDC